MKAFVIVVLAISLVLSLVAVAKSIREEEGEILIAAGLVSILQILAIIFESIR